MSEDPWQYDPNRGVPRPPEMDEPESPPPVWTWLLFLFFKPRRFFPSCAIAAGPTLVTFIFWMCGVSNAIDRLDIRILQRSDMYEWAANSWLAYWAAAILGGAISGALYYAIGGWWYRLRLKWSGADEPDKLLARKVYMFASLVVVLPVVLVTLIDTATFDTPRAASDDEGGSWRLILVVFLFWSCWTSYAGARATYGLRRGLALLWLAILPGVFYVIFLATVFAAMIAMALGPADVNSPVEYENPTMSFSYPGNWFIDTSDPNNDPNSYLMIEAMQDAIVILQVYESARTPEAELEATVDVYDEMIDNFKVIGEFGAWGLHSGVGREYRGTIDGAPYEFRALVHVANDGRYVEVLEFFATADETSVEPGFNLIRRTFQLKP
jgi:hypothetical protein